MADQQEYRDALHNLLPSGFIWPKSRDDSLLGGMLDVLAMRLLAANEVGDSVLADMYPDSNGAFLEDWERVMDLPRPGVTGQTSAERVGTVMAWLNIDPLSNKQFYVDIAALMGYTITVLDYDDGGGLTPEQMQVNYPTAGPEVFFRAGESRAGDRIIENAVNQGLFDLILFFRQAGVEIIFNPV